MRRVGELFFEYKADLLLIITIIIISIVVSNNYAILYIQGNSMYPTYSDKDIVIVKKSKDTSIGDIVVFTPPESWNSNDKRFIKRVIATGGNSISLSAEALNVNNQYEIYVSEEQCSREIDLNVTLEADEFFVLGDNYLESNDSLAQLCNDNDYLISEDLILLSGKEVFVWGGF